MQSDNSKFFFLTGRLFRQEDRLFLTGRHEDMMLGCAMKNTEYVLRLRIWLIRLRLRH